MQAHLKKQGIGSEVYYPLPLHLQPCYADLGHKKGDFPVSEKLAAESLAVPIHSELAGEDIDYVCESIRVVLRMACVSCSIVGARPQFVKLAVICRALAAT